jgi:hypothetical protein
MQNQDFRDGGFNPSQIDQQDHSIRYYTNLRVASLRVVHGGGLIENQGFLTQVGGF